MRNWPPTCNRCFRKLKTLGGILLGPPDANGYVKKWHLCVNCYAEIVTDLGLRDTPRKPR